MNRTMAILPAIAIAGLSGQASAQTPQPMVGAHDPQSVVSALKTAGYKAELLKSDDGDPKITTEFANMVSHVYFYGCTENADCTSLMFTTGFDRKTPWTAQDAIAINANYRFAST